MDSVFPGASRYAIHEKFKNGRTSAVQNTRQSWTRGEPRNETRSPQVRGAPVVHRDTPGFWTEGYVNFEGVGVGESGKL